MLSDQDIFQRYQAKQAEFEKEAEITLIGHSLFDFWQQFPEQALCVADKKVANLGIAGVSCRQYLDVIVKANLIKQLGEDVFIFLGVNDIVKEPDYSPAQVISWLDEILSALSHLAPKARYYLLEATPINQRPNITNTAIQALNLALKQHFSQKITFIETYAAFQDASGQLDPNFCIDGLHFNAKGYAILKRLLQDSLLTSTKPLKKYGVVMSKLSHQTILEKIKQGLIASCQPVDDGPMDSPEIVAAMAHACEIGGAAGIRIEGIENLKAARKAVSLPIIGIVKRDLADSPVRISPFLQDIDDLAQAGADIIAFDGTFRPRPEEIETLVKRIKSHGCLAMADCSNLQEGLHCHNLGVEIIGSTLSGYTGGEIPDEPDFQLVKDLKQAGCFVMAEGRYNTPALAQKAIEIGADAVTVGSALTRLEHIVGWFADAVKAGR